MTQRKTDVNGWFEVKRNPLSRVGVFPYSGRSLGLDGEDANRTFMVYRPEEELSHPECLDSFKLLPWVDEHTMLGPDEGLTPAEQKGVHGVIGENVVYDSGVVYGNIKAFSNSLGRLIEAGKKQLSAGYRCVYDWTAGTFNGRPYDCVQRQIRGNHLALVQEGRMGPSVAVMDALTFTFDAQEAIPMDPKEKDEGKGGAEGMTLADAISMLKQLAPQVAALQQAFSSMNAPAAADKTPPSNGAPAMDAKDKAADASRAAMDEALKPMRESLDKIAATVSTLDAAFKTLSTPEAMFQHVAARDKLAERLAAHVGTFDAADKTLQQVAEYGCVKLELKPAKGQELAALDGYLTAAAKLPQTTVRVGMDAAPSTDNVVTRHLSGAAAK